jgi:hypothetical protein
MVNGAMKAAFARGEVKMATQQLGELSVEPQGEVRLVRQVQLQE